MLRSLPDSIWADVLYYLDESDVHQLRISGDKKLIRCAGMMKSAFFRVMKSCTQVLQNGSYNLVLAVSRWPKTISESLELTKLEVTFLDERRIPNLLREDALPLSLFPKTLTRLTLEFTITSGPFANPFTVTRTSEAPNRLKMLDEHFPCLHTLYNGIRFDGNLQYYVLPSSLTKLSAPHRYPSALQSSDIPLPPNLRFLKLFDTGGDTFPPSLEVLIAHIDTNKLPRMPYLHTLREIEGSIQDWTRFPSLTALDGVLDLSADWSGPPLKLLNTRSPILPTSYIRLPRTLERVTQGGDDYTSTDYYQPFRFEAEHVRDLPPALKELQLQFSQKLSSTTDLFAHLPKTLTTLDMRYTALPASADFSLLPLTLTCLRSHNINHKNVKQLHHLKLIELGLYGGCLTPSFTRQLPRSIRTLRLSAVGLATKGYYYEKGCPLKKQYTTKTPQTTALIDTLPSTLTSLTVAPTTTQIYWWKHAYEIFKSLPLSLEVLRLDFRFEQIHLSPPSPALSEVQPSNEPVSDSSGLSYFAPVSTSIFRRLERLRHLCLRTRLLPKDEGKFAEHLPPSLYAYTGPPISYGEGPQLPKGIKFWRRNATPFLGHIAQFTNVDAVFYSIHPIADQYKSWLDDCNSPDRREFATLY